MNIKLKETRNAYCRECGKRPINEMLVVVMKRNVTMYLCQNCAATFKSELNTIPLAATILPPRRTNNIEDGDLSNI